MSYFVQEKVKKSLLSSVISEGKYQTYWNQCYRKILLIRRHYVLLDLKR